jgi:hypothetical protein
MDDQPTSIEISPSEIVQIKSLPDFDLTMFLSELHDHGWPMARKLLPMIIAAVASNNDQPTDRRSYKI